MAKHWHLIGIGINRWRSGVTFLDTAGGDHKLTHHGWITLEWMTWWAIVRRRALSAESQSDANKGGV